MLSSIPPQIKPYLMRVSTFVTLPPIPPSSKANHVSQSIGFSLRSTRCRSAIGRIFYRHNATAASALRHFAESKSWRALIFIPRARAQKSAPATEPNKKAAPSGLLPIRMQKGGLPILIAAPEEIVVTVQFETRSLRLRGQRCSAGAGTMGGKFDWRLPQHCQQYRAQP